MSLLLDECNCVYCLYSDSYDTSNDNLATTGFLDEAGGAVDTTA